MNIVELNNNQLGDIEHLWKELNLLHTQLSNNFKHHFESFTFASRRKQLTEKEQLKVFVAAVDNVYVGYCIATINIHMGEIDSLYLQQDHQNQGYGKSLMDNAIQWLKSQKCHTINVHIAEGNEAAMGFYENFGFRKRFTVLQQL